MVFLKVVAKIIDISQQFDDLYYLSKIIFCCCWNFWVWMIFRSTYDGKVRLKSKVKCSTLVTRYLPLIIPYLFRLLIVYLYITLFWNFQLKNVRKKWRIRSWTFIFKTDSQFYKLKKYFHYVFKVIVLQEMIYKMCIPRSKFFDIPWYY